MVTIYLVSMSVVIISVLGLRVMWPDDFRRQECGSLFIVSAIPVINTVMAVALGFRVKKKPRGIKVIYEVTQDDMDRMCREQIANSKYK